MEEINQIESEKLKAIATELFKKGSKVTYFGRAWTGCKNNWIYFDTVLDISALFEEYQLGDHFTIHENLDPKSGTERGIIDENSGEALMGKLK